MRFEWDLRKADSNLTKHDVSFEEAATAFGDPFSLTISDRDHSDAEERFILLGRSYRINYWLWSSPKEGKIYESSAPGRPVAGSGKFMKKISKSQPDMLPEYDFSKGVRGKYASRYTKGTNVVVLDPDVAKIFPDAKIVNRSLRKLAKSFVSSK